MSHVIKIFLFFVMADVKQAQIIIANIIINIKIILSIYLIT